MPKRNKLAYHTARFARNFKNRGLQEEEQAYVSSLSHGVVSVDRDAVSFSGFRVGTMPLLEAYSEMILSRVGKIVAR